MNSSNKNIVDAELLEMAYQYTTANFEYSDVVALMKKGPNTGGKDRNHFTAKDGNKYDLYELIVKSIAENPPMMKLDFDTIKKRINEIIIDECKKPTQQAIKESLVKLQELLNEREDVRSSMFYNGDYTIQEVSKQIQKSEDGTGFKIAINNLKKCLKQLDVNNEYLMEIERRAYYVSNEYSEKNTKEQIQSAKQRIMSFIDDMMNIDDSREVLLKVMDNFYLFLEGLLEREPHKKGGIQIEVSEDTGYNTVR